MIEGETTELKPTRMPGGFIIRAATFLPVVATMIASIALMIYGSVETVFFVWEMISSHAASHDGVLLDAIEIIDLFLLATVMQLVSLGLYQLNFNQNLAVPRWLRVRTLDDLKSKLVGVTVTVLAVYFLGRALTWVAGPDIFYFGGAVAAVIAALTYFLSRIEHHNRSE